MSQVSHEVSFNPRTGAENGRLPVTAPAAVDAIVDRAARIADIVANTSPQVRRDWLEAVATALEEDIENLIALADRETALGEVRLRGEILRTAGQLRFYGLVGAVGSYLDVTIDSASSSNPELRRMNVPVGPVAVFGASNFPFAFSVLGNDTASALAAGCPVVVKAHPAHLLLSARLAALAADALTRAGAPADVLQLVIGHEAGVTLVTSDQVAAIGFTGSQSGGLALWRLANERERVIPVYAEMGTVNPVVVTPAACAERIEEIASGFVGSFTLGSGQYCTKPGLLFAPAGSGAAAAVAEALRTSAPHIVMLTQRISHSVAAGLSAWSEAGASIIAREESSEPGWSAPTAVASAPIAALKPGSALLEEVFGAAALVVEYEHTAELLSAVSQLQPSLTASVMTSARDDPDAAVIINHLARQVGRVSVNDWPTGVVYTWAQHHGGPWPATSNAAATSVGAAALARFVRPVAFQSAREEWLPQALQSSNPWRLPVRIDGIVRHASAGT